MTRFVSGRTSATNAEAFERALAVSPGGVNSPVRAFGSVGGTPRFLASGRVWGEDMIIDSDSFADALEEAREREAVDPLRCAAAEPLEGRRKKNKPQTHVLLPLGPSKEYLPTFFSFFIFSEFFLLRFWVFLGMRNPETAKKTFLQIFWS